MKLTRRHKALGGAAAAGLAGAVALAFAVPALAGDTTTIQINPGNVPTTAAGFSTNSCDQIPDATADWLDGWVFVLPESVKAEGNFHYIEAVYQDEDGNVLRFNTSNDGGIVSGSGNNKAYIVTPAGLTLIDAQAEVELKEDDGKGKGKEPQFNLTHTCPATEDEPEEPTTSPEESSPAEEPSSPAEEPSSPGEEPSSPGEEPSSPGEEPSSPDEEPSSPDQSSPAESSPAESSPAASSSAPGQASTTPAGNSLPTTGSPLTYVLVGAAALLVAGIVLLVILRRRTEPGEGA